MDNTKIEWCATTGPGGIVYPGFTFNPWWGCQKVSPACKNCYAEAYANRFAPGHWGPPGTTERKPAKESYWKKPIKWDRQAKELGVKLKVFCASMSDVFEDHPGVIESRGKLWELAEITKNLYWLFLTKRIENVLGMVPPRWLTNGFPENVWIGTTVENQEYADKRIPELLKIPAPVRFVSMEPLCGPVILPFSTLPDLNDYENNWAGFSNALKAWRNTNINWVIAGGESGHKATPSHPEWFRSLREQCKDAGVPFFFKQWGEYKSYAGVTDWADMPAGKIDNSSLYYDAGFWKRITDETPPQKAAAGGVAIRLGKPTAGRMLDGKFYNEMPL